MASKIISNMAGTLLEVVVKVGDNITVGQDVVILESMKMEVAITSSVSGKVTSILKVKGEFVNEGEPVIEIA